MPTVAELWPSQFVSGEEIHAMPEEHADVKILKIDRKKVKNPEGVEKPQVLFEVSGFDRPVIICKTAARIIQGLYGDESTEWIGKWIRLIPLWGKWFGKEQFAVRVANMIPNQAGGKKDARKEAERAKAREMALALVSNSEPLDQWYLNQRSGAGISKQVLADQVISDVKRLELKLSCTAEDLLERLSIESESEEDNAEDSETHPAEQGNESV